jgi:hypothetical protein
MTRTFIRHYLEMVLAMFLGMGVLAGGLAAAGVEIDAVELALLWMAFTMSAPMVAWMRYRGHGWGPSWEMTASMFLPSFAAIALLWIGLVEDRGALMAVQHTVMFPAMLIAMLLRREEYAGHVHA